MKKYKILLVGLLMAFVGWTDGYGQPTSPKYIMFCDGNFNTTSLGWVHMTYPMIAKNYNFAEYFWVDPFQYQNSLVQGVPQLVNFLDETLENTQAATDVLGIAHCIGGIGLRLAQQRNPNITGMVLNGVPNSGSKMMWNLTYKTPNSGKTEVQKLLDDLLRITKADNCDKCDVIGAFAGWVKQFSDGAPHLNYAAHPHSNRNYGDPTQPYINMYGLIQPNDFGIVRMLDSQGGGRGILERCQDERKAIERASDAHEGRKATIKSVTNWWTTALNATAGAIKIVKGDLSGASDLIKAFSTAIKGSSEEIIRKIDKEFKDNQEMARRLRCIMAQQLLEAEWLIMMSGDYDSEEGEVIEFGDDNEGYYDCLWDCEQRYSNDDTRDIFICISDCYQDYINIGIVTLKTFITFTPEPSDGLYTQSEMRLPSGQQRGDDIIFHGVDHFQETTSDEVHNVFFNQIFTGAQPYGPEFFVPKN